MLQMLTMFNIPKKLRSTGSTIRIYIGVKGGKEWKCVVYLVEVDTKPG